MLFVDRFDFIGVTTENAKSAIGKGVATPTPGCFSQRVRNAQKILGIWRITNGKECVID